MPFQNAIGFFETVGAQPAVTFNDWFLPSKDELNAMYTELHLHGVGGFIDYSEPEYPQGAHWSSSENGVYDAFAIEFTTGDSAYGDKMVGHYVRACRTFTSTTNYNLRDVGPAGGWIFWKSGNDYLEAAPSDLYHVGWSNIVDAAIGTTGTAIGTGQSNTTAIINQVGHTASAAKLCNDLVIVH